MTSQIPPAKPVKPKAKPGPKPKPKPKSVVTAGTPLKPRRKPKPPVAKVMVQRFKPGLRRSLSWLVLEIFSLGTAVVFTTMLAIGYAAYRFGGSDFLENLLPFVLGIAGWIVLLAVLLNLWGRLRQRLLQTSWSLPALLSLILAVAVTSLGLQPENRAMSDHFRGLLGGRQQAAKLNLAHQVYAAYRRYTETDLQAMIDRAQLYDADIRDAAASYDLDLDVLMGVAATESSFLPRDSVDGGHGLFQITAVPKFIQDQAQQQLGVDKLSMLDNRHNAFVAAATLKYYLAEMNNDLFLGLLAYNIGPRNGGLKFIMEQYGATDFVSMQPYLQQLPRDYPIRVLSHSLAFRIWHHEGRLLAYQDGDNALHIQRLGIPGLLNML